MELFGEYSILKRIGGGRVTEVCLAEGPQGFSALKRLVREYARDEPLRDQLAKEGAVLQSFAHEGIPRVYSRGEVDGQPYISMELVDGIDLRTLWDRSEEPWHPRVVSRIAIDAAEALAHVHTELPDTGRVHADVNPSNLVIGQDGRTRVIDFGIAVRANSVPDEGTLRGTYRYMAPEQVRGEVLDGRADIFSLGVVLWEMCHRKSLFRRETPQATLRAVVEDPIPADSVEAPSDHQPGFTLLSPIIAKALARERDDRWRSIEELLTALRAAEQESRWTDSAATRLFPVFSTLHVAGK